MRPGVKDPIIQIIFVHVCLYFVFVKIYFLYQSIFSSSERAIPCVLVRRVAVASPELDYLSSSATAPHMMIANRSFSSIFNENGANISDRRICPERQMHLQHVPKAMDSDLHFVSSGIS